MNEDMRFAEAMKRCEAATPGPWRCGYTANGTLPAVFAPGVNKIIASRISSMKGFDRKGYGDADFIAHAREDLPWALYLILDREDALDKLDVSLSCKIDKLTEALHQINNLAGAFQEEGPFDQKEAFRRVTEIYRLSLLHEASDAVDKLQASRCVNADCEGCQFERGDDCTLFGLTRNQANAAISAPEKEAVDVR